MKPVPPGFLAWMLSAQQMVVAELYTFSFASGAFDRFTNFDTDIIYGGNTFKGSSIRISGLKSKLAIGWQVDEQTISIDAYPGETLGGSSFFGALQSGLLDGAYFTRQRAFWEVVDGRPSVDVTGTPKGVITVATMRVSTINKIGRTRVELKIKSPLSLLDIDMPRNTYEPGCQWELFSTGCTLSRASFQTNFTVLTATATSITPTVAVSPVTGADGVAYYGLGRLTFTSGVDNSLFVSIINNDATSFYLRQPLINVPSPGDTFFVNPGCAKTGRGGACDLKFANLQNFRGFPRVPSEVMSI